MNEARRRFSAVQPLRNRSAGPLCPSTGAESSSCGGHSSPSWKGQRGSLPYNAQDMAQLLWAVAGCGVQSLRDDWAAAYCRALLPVVPELTPQGVSMVLHSLARLRYSPPRELLVALCGQLVLQMQKGSGAEGTGDGSGSSHSAQPIVQADAAGLAPSDCCAQPCQGHTPAPPPADADLGRPGCSDPGAVEARLGGSAQWPDRSGERGAQGRLETTQHTSAAQQQPGLEEAPGRRRQGIGAPGQGPQQAPAADGILQMHKPYGEHEVEGEVWDDAGPVSAAPELQEEPGAHVWTSAAPLSTPPVQLRAACLPADLSISLWALATLRLTPGGYCPQLLDAVETYSLHRLPDFPEQELSNLVWALARLQYRPGPGWVSQLYDTVGRLLPELRPQALSTVLYGMSQMGLRPDARWLEVVLPYVRSRLRWFPPQSLALTIYALAAMGCRPAVGPWRSTAGMGGPKERPRPCPSESFRSDGDVGTTRGSFPPYF
jgi:hypothetical protein